MAPGDQAAETDEGLLFFAPFSACPRPGPAVVQKGSICPLCGGKGGAIRLESCDWWSTLGRHQRYGFLQQPSRHILSAVWMEALQDCIPLVEQLMLMPGSRPVRSAGQVLRFDVGHIVVVIIVNQSVLALTHLCERLGKGTSQRKWWYSY